jgi:peptidoglycan/xylan/chitin deacetylase (PgdA/CDA1 family)
MKSLIFVVGLLAWLLAWPAMAGAQPTVVSIEFDDGLADAYQASAPLAQNGLHATFYINSGRVGSSDAFMTWPQLHDLANAANEIGGHTVLHADLSELDSNEQTREICDDRVSLIDRGFQPTDFAYPYGAGAQSAQTRAIAEHCGYNSARGVSGVFSPNYGCDTCAYAETIPPKNYYATRAPQSILTNTSVGEMENYVTQAQQHGGGWVQLIFHHICNSCNPYAVTLPDFDTLMAWLRSQSRQHSIVVKTVKQVIGGPFKRGVQGPAPPVSPSSDMVSNPWFKNWKQVISGGEGSSATTEPVCFQASNWGHNNVTLTRVKDSPAVDANGYSAQLQVTGYTLGAAEIITSQLDLGACNPILKDGHDYRITAWYKSDARANMMLFVRDPRGGWRYWTEGPTVSPTSAWRQVTLVSPALPRGDIQLSFGMGLKSNGTLRVDGYTLREAASAGRTGALGRRLTIVALLAVALCIGVGVDIWYHRDRVNRVVTP